MGTVCLVMFGLIELYQLRDFIAPNKAELHIVNHKALITVAERFKA
jgi:hypothetical protein